MPWLELFVGIFLVLGLWLPWTLKAAMGLFLGFILVVAQALIRHLPITKCGCFGELISVPLPVILMMDSSLLLITGILLLKKEKTNMLSLDNYFK